MINKLLSVGNFHSNLYLYFLSNHLHKCVFCKHRNYLSNKIIKFKHLRIHFKRDFNLTIL